MLICVVHLCLFVNFKCKYEIEDKLEPVRLKTSIGVNCLFADYFCSHDGFYRDKNVVKTEECRVQGVQTN